jgi:HAD superfamily hydrolase (TIGR01509 family)
MRHFLDSSYANLTSITNDLHVIFYSYTTPQRLAWHTTGDPSDKSGEKLGQEFDDLYVALVSPSTTPLYDGIRDLIDKVAAMENIKLAALSNACGAYVKAVMKVHELDSKFQLALGADDVPYAKPRPEGLLEICRKLDIDPRQCVYIGDSPSDGIAAKAAQMKSIGVSWGSHPVDSITPNFDRVVHSIDELQEEIFKHIREQLL